VWISARARNALRRPAFITAVSIVTFMTSLLALIIVPQQARKAAAALRPPSASRPDTESTVAAMTEAERQVAAAESTLARTRVDLVRLVSATAAATAADTGPGGAQLSSTVRTQRDALAGQIDLLGKLIERADNAPLLGSYRALAQSAPMQADPRVKQMLDSLVEIERERDSYSAVGGVDPVFVALTARANELGRNIAAFAEAHRAALRKEMAAIAPAPSAISATVAAKPPPDTLATLKLRDDAIVAAAGVASRLSRERAELQQLDAREERARELSAVGASPTAILAAALVFGAVLGFGSALFAEMRRPRVADAAEVEHVTGARVLGIVRPMAATAERRRRAADRAAPPYMDSGGDGHQLIYLNVATAGSSSVMLTVTGDHPSVSAIVAVNFAAIAADEARATLVVDTDSSASAVAAVLHLRPSEGISAAARGSAEWPDITQSARVGRDRTIDVVPSGSRPASFEDLAGLLQRDGARLSRRYDAVVLVSSVDQVRQALPLSLPVPDVIVCARAGQTHLSDLYELVVAIRDTGANPKGIVIWNAVDPSVAPSRPAAAPVRDMAEAEI